MSDNILTKSKSNILHLLRWLSALVVVVGHSVMVDEYVFGKRDFTFLYNYISMNAHTAVMVFFVLSGYLISYTSSKLDSLGRALSVRKYLIDRWSRIFSVLIPCLLLTIISDFAGNVLFPQIYQNPQIIPQDNALLRFVVNLLALQGTWGQRIQFGSNSPLWSIGYEFTFYLMFGLYLFGREKPKWARVYFIGGIIFIAAKGPLLIGYSLIWFMGVIAHRIGLIYKLKLTTTYLFISCVSLLVLNHYIMLADIFRLPQYSSDFAFSFFIACFLSLEYPDQKYSRYRKKLVNLNKVMASFSFTLYATHLPVMLLFYAASFNYIPISRRLDPTVFGIIGSIFCVAFAYLFARISEEKRGTYRILAEKLISRILLRCKLCKGSCFCL